MTSALARDRAHRASESPRRGSPFISRCRQTGERRFNRRAPIPPNVVAGYARSIGDDQLVCDAAVVLDQVARSARREAIPNNLMMMPARAAIAAPRRAMRRNVLAAGMPRCWPEGVDGPLPLNKPYG